MAVDCTTGDNCGSLGSPDRGVQQVFHHREVTVPWQDFPLSPYASGCDDTAEGYVPPACPPYPNNIKYIPVAFDAAGVLQRDYADYATWYADACANGGGFLDQSNPANMPGGPCNRLERDCLEMIVIDKGTLKVPLCECTAVANGDGVQFVVDAGRSLMSPMWGEIVSGDPTSLPVSHLGKGDCCVNHVIVDFDFTKTNVC